MSSPKNDVSIRSIRFATKERPTDRFLTAQAREATTQDDAPDQGDLYFVVEIHNPWFPNSQIGQTIINTVVREFRRGQSTSILNNFELALRKTNQVLAQITQSGETDWIGNLSSLILLTFEGHVYVAQTGRARAYLIRGKRLSDITEGLDEEASQHPLTTYTNITSGTLEPHDRLLLTSSEVPEMLSLAELKTTLTTSDDSLPDTARELIGVFQHAHIRRMNGFLLEAGGDSATNSETLYVDQSLNNPTEFLSRFIKKTVRPGLAQSGHALRTHGLRALGWTRDSLLPQLIDWSRHGRSLLKDATKSITQKAQPLLDQGKEQLKARLPIMQSNEEIAEIDELTGKTIYRVHHYSERRKARVTIPPTLVKFIDAANKPWAQLTSRIKLPGKFQTVSLARPQILLLGIAAVVIIFLAVSASGRFGKRTEEVKQSTAVAALAEAKGLQQTAERSFLAEQKELAKTQFVLAITKAQEATNNPETESAATALITQSEAILDQLMTATRIEEPNLLASFDAPLEALVTTNQTLFAIDGGKGNLLSITLDGSVAAPETITQLPETANPNTGALIDTNWFVATPGYHLMKIDLLSSTPTFLKPEGEEILTISAISRFSTTLYGLDQIAGQIWKYTPTTTGLGTKKPYLKTAEPDILKSATSLAIDGEVYVLLENGTVRKYTKGDPVSDWKLSELPTPWSTIEKPLALFTNAETSKLFVLEQQTTDHPARMLEFDKQGIFVSQHIFPKGWELSTWTFDPAGRTGYFSASDQKIYQIDLPQS